MPIRPEGTAPRPVTVRRYAVALLAGAMGVCLVGLAAPRTVANLAGVEGDEIVRTLRLDGENGAAETLAAGIASLERRAFWLDAGLTDIDRGTLLFRQAQGTQDANERQHLLASAAAGIEQGLAKAPGNPSAWAQLAGIEALQGRRRAAVAALRLSLLTGAVTPGIMASRLALGLYLLDSLDGETRNLLAGQVRLTWTIDPDKFPSLTRVPAGQDFIRQALAELSDTAAATYSARAGTGG